MNQFTLLPRVPSCLIENKDVEMVGTTSILIYVGHLENIITTFTKSKIQEFSRKFLNFILL